MFCLNLFIGLKSRKVVLVLLSARSTKDGQTRFQNLNLKKSCIVTTVSFYSYTVNLVLDSLFYSLTTFAKEFSGVAVNAVKL